jgi:hypothetical protein
LAYVLSSWLYCRYPGGTDPVWSNPMAHIQPSRSPFVSGSQGSPVYPALSPLQPGPDGEVTLPEGPSAAG